MTRTGLLLTVGLLIAALSGCGAAIPAAVVGGGAAVAGATAIGWIDTGVTVLNETAKLACSVQAIANTVNRPQVSAVAGELCKW